MLPITKIGIIDIGSNSMRLVIYEYNERGVHRVIDEAKESARLSERIDESGMLTADGMRIAADTLAHFRVLCEAAGVSRIRAVATAAIRNAARSAAIVAQLERESGLSIEVLSGHEEARIGFLGMINTLDTESGYAIDIGGGSTELTLFVNRRMVHSVSFTFGAVQMARVFGSGEGGAAQLGKMAQAVAAEAAKHSWIGSHPGLPMIGLGGTARSLCAIDQKRKSYSMPVAHNYPMSGDDVRFMLDWLHAMPVDERKKVDGLSRQRVDLIVPGAVILDTLFRQCRSTGYIISGAGLRDGLLAAMLGQQALVSGDVLERSVGHLLELHPNAPLAHLRQVNRLAAQLYAALRGNVENAQPGQRRAQSADRLDRIVHAASLLYRVGTAVNFYDYERHTFYMIAHSRIYGLTHRETLLCACVASYKNKKRTRQLIARYPELADKQDVAFIGKLGLLVQLAVALDRSHTQPLSLINADVRGKRLLLQAEATRDTQIEERQVAAIANDFAKEWGLAPALSLMPLG